MKIFPKAMRIILSVLLLILCATGCGKTQTPNYVEHKQVESSITHDDAAQAFEENSDIERMIANEFGFIHYDSPKYFTGGSSMNDDGSYTLERYGQMYGYYDYERTQRDARNFDITVIVYESLKVEVLSIVERVD